MKYVIIVIMALNFPAAFGSENEVEALKAENEALKRENQSLRQMVAAAAKDTNKIETGASGKSLPLDEEAVLAAEQAFLKHWSKCADSYVTRWSFSGNLVLADFIQVKGIKLRSHSRKLDKADELNGIEWAGTVEFTAEAARFHTSSEYKSHYKFDDNEKLGWNEWFSTGLKTIMPRISLTRTNGKWSDSQNAILEDKQAVPCDEVPQE